MASLHVTPRLLLVHAAGRSLSSKPKDHEARLIIDRLAAEGFEVGCATNIKTAATLAAREGVDLVIVDGDLQRDDAITVCRHLRHDPLTATLPIVLLASTEDTRWQDEDEAERADACVTKPVSPQILVTAVRDLLGQDAWPGANPIGRILQNIDRLLAIGDLNPDLRRELDACQQELLQVGHVLSRPAESPSATKH